MLEENGEHNWVFDTISKKTMIGRLFTSMSGSVVTSGAVSGGRGSNRAKENANPNKKSKVAKAKAKAKAASSSGAALSVKDLPEECDVKKVTAACCGRAGEGLGRRPFELCTTHHQVHRVNEHPDRLGFSKATSRPHQNWASFRYAGTNAAQHRSGIQDLQEVEYSTCSHQGTCPLEVVGGVM